MKQLLSKFLIGLTLTIFSVQPAMSAAEEKLDGPTEIIVHKSPWCGCCKSWISILRQTGYEATILNEEAMGETKKRLLVPDHLQSCHTAEIGGYIVEGHVPMEDIARLLKEKPDAIGISVPGMPIGSPGMEQGDRKDKYDVILFKADGTEEVFSSH